MCIPLPSLLSFRNVGWLLCLLALWPAASAPAQDPADPIDRSAPADAAESPAPPPGGAPQPADPPPPRAPQAVVDQDPATLSLRQVFSYGGVIGVIILALSVAMVALISEHLLSIRRGALMPAGLPEETHRLIQQHQFHEAAQKCRESGSFLGHVLAAGLGEVGLGYHEIEKSMEDASAEQAARLFRKIEYLSVIGTLAPMLGLLGTVWGMIQAFLEFEREANPQVSELAPGIYKALVTTLLGLSVAVPAIASYAFFRNRIDELVAEASLLAEHVFSDFKRALLTRRKANTKERRRDDESPGA